MLRPEFAGLFTDSERRIARKRLKDYGFDGDLPRPQGQTDVTVRAPAAMPIVTPRNLRDPAFPDAPLTIGYPICHDDDDEHRATSETECSPTTRRASRVV